MLYTHLHRQIKKINIHSSIELHTIHVCTLLQPTPFMPGAFQWLRREGHGPKGTRLRLHVALLVMVIYSALVRPHQSTYEGSFGPVPPLLRRCGRASNCGWWGSPDLPARRDAHFVVPCAQAARAEEVDVVFFGKPHCVIPGSHCRLWGGRAGPQGRPSGAPLPGHNPGRLAPMKGTP